jgi:hypothetical protein
MTNDPAINVIESKVQILVVMSEEPIANYMKVFLEDAGYAVEVITKEDQTYCVAPDVLIVDPAALMGILSACEMSKETGCSVMFAGTIVENECFVEMAEENCSAEGVAYRAVCLPFDKRDFLAELEYLVDVRGRKLQKV